MSDDVTDNTEAFSRCLKAVIDAGGGCVNDPDNLGVADINYWVVIGNVGVRDVFIKQGGASIRARRIGTAASPDGKAGASTVTAAARELVGDFSSAAGPSATNSRGEVDVNHEHRAAER